MKPQKLTFLCLVNAFALDPAAAYRQACRQWGVDSLAQRSRLEADGIVYQGSFGSEVYALWKDWPAPTRP